MRAIIISEIEGTLKKIAWLKECSGGIYFGFYGKTKGLHISYHQDGNVRMRQGFNRLPMYNTKAINDITKFTSITNYGIPLEKGYEFAMSDYIKSKDSTAIIYINPETLERTKTLSIYPYIVRRDAEKDCILELKKSLNLDKRFEVISANFFKLEIFKNFLAGIILCGGK